MIDLNFKYKNLLSYLSKINPFGSEEPHLTLILGSGMGDFAEKVNIIHSVSTYDLPGYPPSTIEGHLGKISFAEFRGKRLLIFQGRLHPYEGYKISECILPIWITHKLHCKRVLLTNAAGGINADFKPGDLMLASSFNTINIKRELTVLIGLADVKGRNSFLDFPSASLNKLLTQASLEEGIELKEGVYWYTKGPSYETPAEIRMMKTFGGDAVGMSTAYEAVFSARMGIETASISCITNYAAGIYPQKLSHEDVTKTAEMARDKFERLVKNFIIKIP